MTQSPHQLVYNLYNIIALTEIKGYAMLQFSYMMLKIYDKVSFKLLYYYILIVCYDGDICCIVGQLHC